MGERTLLWHGRRVRVSILASFAALVSFVVASFLVSVYLLEGKTHDAELARTVHAVDMLLRQKLEKEAALMQAVVATMAVNPAIADALDAGARDRLSTLVGPLFARLRDMHGLTHLYFTDAELVNLLRMHEPGWYGDTINRLTTLRARQTGSTVHGIEFGLLGTLTLRTVVPWQKDGRRVGYVELGEEIEHVLRDIGDILDVGLIALVEKPFLSREQWQRGRTLLGKSGDWSDFESLALVGHTGDVSPQRLGAHLAAITPGASSEIELGGRTLYLAALPITDAGERRVGRLVLVRDVTALTRTFRQSLILATLVSSGAGVAVFLFFAAALGRVEQTYRRQHELEHQLLRLNAESQRMVQVEKLSALGTMIGEIAHQLNNPLVGVVNMAQLAERHADDPQRLRQLLERIRSAGSDCRAFVQRMLEFSKVSSSERRPIDLRHVVQEAASLFRQSTGRRVSLSLDLPDAAVIIPVDAVLLRHALFNLLTNAAQAVADDGAVVVALHPCCSTDGSDGWRLSVTDNGPGFPPELADKLFTPFFTTRRDGTGLGLPVVQHVALVHDGTVSAANRPEGGAEFAVWLPQILPALGMADQNSGMKAT